MTHKHFEGIFKKDGKLIALRVFSANNCDAIILIAGCFISSIKDRTTLGATQYVDTKRSSVTNCNKQRQQQINLLKAVKEMCVERQFSKFETFHLAADCAHRMRLERL